MKRKFILELEVDWDEEVLEDMHPELVMEDAIPLNSLMGGTSLKMVKEIPEYVDGKALFDND